MKKCRKCSMDFQEGLRNHFLCPACSTISKKEHYHIRVGMRKCKLCGIEFEVNSIHKRFCPQCYRLPHRSNFAQCGKCTICGKQRNTWNPKTTLCRQCFEKNHKVEKNGAWKGGIRKPGKLGYVRYYPNGDSKPWVLYHRYVWEQHYGKLPNGWQVHHINGIRWDNRIENLQAMPAKDHYSLVWEKVLQKRIRALEAEVKSLQPPLMQALTLT